MVAAKANGYKCQIGSDGKLSVTDARGAAVDVSSLTATGKAMYTESGLAHTEQLFNQIQTSAVNEYRSNQQSISNATQTVREANADAQSRHSAVESAVTMHGGTMNPSGNIQINLPSGASLQLDATKAMRGLGEELAKAQSEGRADDQKKLDELKKSLEAAGAEQYFTSKALAERTSKDLELLVQKQEELSGVVEHVGQTRNETGEWSGATLSMEEKVSALSKSADDIAKKVTAVDAKMGQSGEESKK